MYVQKETTRNFIYMAQEKEHNRETLNEVFEEPMLQIVKLEGAPITADSDNCYWQSER